MSDKRIFITGANGQLGRDLVHEFTLRGIECVASDIQDNFSGEESCRYVKLDITDFDSVDRALNDTKPQRVIHCAAWTAVDAAEEEANRQKVYAVNVAGTENIAKACAKYDIIMTYISTDYIFDGKGTRPWQPDDDSYSPLNYYGETKLKGELAVKKYLKKFFIVRIAWVFGKNGNNFVRTMLKIAKTHDTL